MKKQYFAAIFVILLSYNNYCLAEKVNYVKPPASEFGIKPQVDTSNELRDLLKDTRLQLLSAQSEIDRLQDSLYALKKTDSEKDGQIINLKKENQQLSANISNLSLSSKEFDEQKSILENKDKQLQLLVNSYTQKQKEMNDRLEAYECQLNEKAVQLNEKAAQLLATQDCLTKAQKELDDVKGKNIAAAQSAEDIMVVKKRLAENDILISQLEKQIDTYRSNIDKMSSKLAESQDELTRVRTELSQNKANLLASNEVKCKPVLESKALDNIKMAVSEKTDNQDFSFKVIQYMKNDKPSAAVVYYNIGRVYQDNKDYLKAIDNYTQVIQMDPDFNKAYMQLGLAYAETGDYDKSVESFKQYLKYTDNPKEVELIRQFVAKLGRII